MRFLRAQVWVAALAGFSALVLLTVGWRISREPDRRLAWVEEFEGPRAIVQLPKWEKGKIAGGELRLTTQSRFPGLTLREGLPLRAGPLDTIRIRMATDGPERQTRLAAHFSRVGEEKRNAFGHPARMIAAEVTISPTMTWFTLPLSRDGLWRGEIKTLRIDPVGDAKIPLRIDRIELAREGRSFQGGPTPGWALALAQACGPVWAPLTALWLALAVWLVARPPPRRMETVLWIFGLALAPRLIYIGLPLLDSFVTSDPAQWLKSGRGIWSGEGPRGYPVWGWAWQAVLGAVSGSGEGAQGTYAARLALALISSATAILVYRVGRRVVPRRAALAAALLWSVTEEPVRFCGVLYSETFFTFWVCLFLIMGYRARRRGLGRWDRAGLVITSCVIILTRSQAAPLVLAVWAWLAWSRSAAFAAWRVTFPLAGFMLAGVLGGSLSLIEHREWIALQTGLGQNLAVGHGPNANGRWVKLDPAWRARAEAETSWKARDRKYRELAVDNIKQAPGTALKRTAVKLGLILNPWERSDWFYQPIFMFPLAPRWIHWLLLIPGLWALRRCWDRQIPLLSHVALTSGLVAVFFFNERFLAPILPVAAIYAVAAPAALGTWVIRKFGPGPVN